MQNNYNKKVLLFVLRVDGQVDGLQRAFAVFVGIDGAKPQYIKYRYMCFFGPVGPTIKFMWLRRGVTQVRSFS